MPQSPIGGATDGIPVPAMFTTRGGNQSKLNMTAAAVIKAAKGRLARIVVLNGGTTGGAFTFNDATTTAAAAAANAFFTIPQGAAAGSTFDVDWPCANGIVLSAVPTGGTPIIAVSYR